MKTDKVENFVVWEPDFRHEVVNQLFELENLRAYQASGTTPHWIFWQLRDIFHQAESLMSLRLEGNTTEIVEYAEARLSDTPIKEPIREVSNYEKALNHLIKHINGDGDIDEEFIHELHEIVVEGLTPVEAGGDGDSNAGQFSFLRETGVRRVGSPKTGTYHYPPVFPLNVQFMGRLLDFISKDHPLQYEAIKIAQTHQHFAWIHPYNNGNGRVGRLLTYAMLMKAGFSVQGLMTPSSIFCEDRERYSSLLAACDNSDDDNAKMEWLSFVFDGIIREFKKIRQLMDFEFVRNNILKAAIEGANEHGKIDKNHYKILKAVYHLNEFQNKDTKSLGMTPQYRSTLIKSMIENGLAKPIEDGKRTYRINYVHPQLMYGVLKALRYQEMLPSADKRLAQAIEQETNS